MGREYVFYCDHCGKPFAENPHINLSSVDINISYFTKNADTADKPATLKRGKWSRSKLLQTRTIDNQKAEYHFCDLHCLTEFIRKQPIWEEAKGTQFDPVALKAITEVLKLDDKPKAVARKQKTV